MAGAKSPTKKDDLDELLMHDYGRRASVPKKILYFFLALLPFEISLVIFTRVLDLDIFSTYLLISISVFVSAIVLSLAYHNLTFARSVKLRKTFHEPTKSLFRNKPEEHQHALVKHESKLKQSSFAYSIAYNNVLVMAIMLVLGAYVLKDKIQPEINFGISSVVAGAIAYINSISARKLAMSSFIFRSCRELMSLDVPVKMNAANCVLVGMARMRVDQFIPEERERNKYDNNRIQGCESVR
eukprot:CAMPEP_0184693194 /NCGR_PEP_ID=MMETSP0313-20130426/1475_1 /TAXON_ID=2792 /ORGANISM="Porphyridium aerugineum, Strain SAG 1380-2" /LENGTH=240 /DNA_ID=CAMNT_0027151207 /DNA_START=57 /DNA_END=777 /DNA_ORIENTATION=+